MTAHLCEVKEIQEKNKKKRSIKRRLNAYRYLVHHQHHKVKSVFLFLLFSVPFFWSLSPLQFNLFGGACAAVSCMCECTRDHNISFSVKTRVIFVTTAFLCFSKSVQTQTRTTHTHTLVSVGHAHTRNG